MSECNRPRDSRYPNPARRITRYATSAQERTLGQRTLCNTGADNQVIIRVVEYRVGQTQNHSVTEDRITAESPWWTRVINGTAVGFSILAAFAGIVSMLGLDHSDDEINSSLVDTWQASALGSYPLLVGTLMIAGISFLFARNAHGVHRGKLLFTTSAAVAGFALEFIGMLVLTARAETLTGHNLSGLFYFF